VTICAGYQFVSNRLELSQHRFFGLAEVVNAECFASADTVALSDLADNTGIGIPLVVRDAKRNYACPGFNTV
ncbi:MAG: hypothetical protein OEQ14_15220, partial [Gammaproteobacteria bacterium]|nr:hypothetical protein [Gammaproteobacteria bacterium]